MSAIAGMIASTTEDLRFISAMTDLLAHRGPHGDGIFWMKENGSTRLERDMLPSTSPIPARVVLGHRQFTSIGDATPQPLAIDDGHYWITYDGALYNYRELRTTLEALGHHFTTDSDAEVILVAYKQYGLDCFQHFTGPWALAILDTKDRSLVLARDPLGQRPLYYWTHRGRTAFASEIKALFAIPEIRPKLERQSLTEFIRFGGMLNEGKSTFAHIVALPPGHAVQVKLDSTNPLKSAPYAVTKLRESIDDSALPARLRELFLTAIEQQRQSPLDVGTCLTGGLNSTAIACALRQQMGDESIVNSFSAIFEEPGIDERTWITAANGAAHTLSNWVMPQAEDFMSELDVLLWHQDEPFATPGVYAQWCVTRAAREAKTGILLDGLGANEYFGIQPKPSFMQRLMPHRSDEARVLARLLSMPGNLTGQTSTLASALRTSDRNAMAFGVELRQPYLDPKLIALSQSVPNAMKENKQLLRQALGEFLPEPIGTRASLPAFSVPQEAWMQMAILPAFLRDIKLARTPLVPVIHGGELRELVSRQMERPTAALNALIFRLFIANRWMQRFNIAPVI